MEGRKLSQLAENVNAAVQRAKRAAGEGTTSAEIRAFLEDELSNLIYVFPDDQAAMTVLRSQLPKEVAKILPRGLKSAARSIGILFEGKLP